MLSRLSDLERRPAVPYAVLMIGANVIGAAIVFALIRWVLPLPDVEDPDHVQRVNVLALVAYLVFAVPAGMLWALWLLRPVLTWLRADRPPTEDEQRTVLLIPAREIVVHASLWALGGVVFTIINVRYEHDLALIVAITVALAGAATCAVAYLLAQRVLRPVAARALADHVPDDPALPGITARLLLTYILGTGVPVLGLVLVGAGVLTDTIDASAHRLAVTALLLGGIALVVGIAVMALTARSLADPLEALRGALRRVQGGDQEAQVDVYDGSELGLLQAGFNRMVEGLREREELRDMFGRQVGEDVARQALERGITLGGEELDVAVLFIDLVGSTELAHDRPPAEVVELLNEFFCVVVDVVDAQDGSVNKFVGDAALCVFGAPLPPPDAAGGARGAAAPRRRGGRGAARGASAARAPGRRGAAVRRGHRRLGRHRGGRQHRRPAALRVHGDRRPGQRGLAADRAGQAARRPRPGLRGGGAPRRRG